MTTVAGMAMSEDGLHWRVTKRPLMGNVCGTRGAFAPILTTLWGRWLMLFERKGYHDIGGAVSLGPEVTGPYEDIGTVIPARPGIRNVGWPFPVFLGDHLYVLYGGQMGKRGAIYASVVDWREGL